MHDYEQSVVVSAGADRVFDIVSDVGNLPKYFAHMTSATPEDGEAVHTVAEVDGRRTEGDAWFQVDDGARDVRWGAPGPHDYSGELHVDDDAAGSVVRLRLHTSQPDDGRMSAAMRESLDSLRSLVETGS